TSVLLTTAAPNNPFASNIRVTFPATGLSGSLDTESETVRASAGLIVRLPHDWSGAVDYSWNRSRFTSRSNQALVGDPDGTGPAVNVNTALANGTLDVVRDLNAAPLNWSSYLLPTPNVLVGPNDSVLRDATLRLSGPLLSVPAGPVTLAGSLEH